MPALNPETLLDEPGIDTINDLPAVVRPLTIWTPSQFLKYVEPEGRHLLLPRYLMLEQTLALIGPPGVGKSRLLLWLAICQITGHPWCGLETGGEPQRWLQLGDENSISRLKHDLERMLSALSETERELVESHLRLLAVVTPEDGDLDLQDDAVAMRVTLTLQEWKPGVVTFDPLASFYAGDLSKPGEMKAAVRLVQQTVRAGAREAATVISHHARTGRNNTLQAVGFDAGNFASGGKALLARCRAVINFAEADEEGTGRVVVACAKSNDCPRFEPRSVSLDPRTMTYTLDDGFDVETWRAHVEGKRTAGGLCTLRDVVEAVRDGYTTTREIIDAMASAMCAKQRNVERLIKQAVQGRFLAKISRGKFALGAKHKLLLDKD